MKKNIVKKITGEQNKIGAIENLIKQISKKESSARTTFSLTKNGETALTWINEHSKKSIKSVINSLCEQLWHTLTDENEGHFGKTIIQLAKETPKCSIEKIRRSMVLSKKSLKILNDVAKKYQVPRDALLDRGFCVFVTLIKTSEETRLENHKKALPIINKLWGEAEKVEKELADFLEEDDPILCGLGYTIVHLMNLNTAIEKEQKDGTPIDPDNI